MIILVMAACGWAQIVITAPEVPSVPGTQFRYYSQSDTINTIPVNVGTTGGPQVWDFTQGDTSSVNSDLYLDPQTSPPQYSRANVVIQTDEFSQGGTSQPGIMYCILQSFRLAVGAVTIDVQGTSADMVFRPLIQQFPLPLRVGRSWTNVVNVDQTYQLPQGTVRIQLHSTVNSQVDAYGTARVPLGDYPALRVRNDVTYDITVSLWVLFIWVPIYEETSQNISYDWRAENVGLALNVMADGTNPNFTLARHVRRLMSSNTLTDGDLTAENPVTPLPASCELLSSYPNPFNSQTTIPYELSQAAEVDLRIFDITGREVALLVQGWRQEGRHEIRWNADHLSAGVYFVRLQAGGQMQQQMIVYLK